ncbi:MAG TPA: redoxin family protein [Edaphobacter sp.]|nr:redoxin family protein [Edaphobacter sp.]
MRRQIISASLCLLFPFCLRIANAQQTQAFRTDPKFISAMAEAKTLVTRRQYIFAIDSYKKANKVAGGQCADCLSQILSLQMSMGSYKDAVATATALETLATTPADKSLAKFNRGQALYLQAGDKGKPELLNAAHTAFQAALVDNPKNANALYLDGHALAKLGKMDEARDDFKACVSCVSPKDPAYVRAKHFAENPALSLAKMAPAFTVTALDGSRFNLDEMGGRVVLIDFWATWCGPCNAELPHIKKIAKEFAGQPLVIISVSWDSDTAKWKNFIARNEMTWVQYLDADHSLSKNFGVEAIPHYFTIDSDGVLTAEMMGSGSDVEGKLKKLVAKAKAAGATALPVVVGN